MTVALSIKCVKVNFAYELLVVSLSVPPPHGATDLLLYNTTLQQINIRAPGGIRTHGPNERAAADPRLGPRGHWDRLICSLLNENRNLAVGAVV